MKRLLTSAALLLCSMAMLAQFTGTVTDEQGVQYTANEDETTCYVSGHTSNLSSSIVVAGSFEGRSVTSIGIVAFHRCTGLTSVTLPDGLTSIGSSAFFGCSGLTSITLPEGLTSIERYAFFGCTSLASINIPSSVTSIGGVAFSETAWYNGQPDGLVYLGKWAYKYKGEMPLNTSMSLLEGTLGIADGAFEKCTGLTSITLPDGLTSIGGQAFFGCTGLTSITLPEGFTSIGGGAFSGCTNLTSIVVDGNNPTYDSRDNCNAIVETSTNTLIIGCKTTIIPESVMSIGRGAFYGCSGLTSISLPDGLSSIGDDAFSRCSGLTSITLPDGLSSIGNSVFQDCSSLASIMFPVGLTSIGNSAFSNCSGLTSITLPEGLTSIEGYAFSGCTGLTSITIPEGIKTINDTTFSGCSSLTSITLPDGLTSIGNSAFEGCSSLASITLPDGLTSIGYWAFEGCSSLASITLPDGLTSIGDWAFEGCTSLTTLVLPEGVNVVGYGLIDGCTGITITIPSSVTDKVNNIIEGSTKTSVVIPDGETSIKAYFFSHCEDITIFIPKSVRSIGQYAFQFCNNISVVMCEGVTSIPSSFLDKINGLTSISLPASLTSIRNLRGLNSLTSIVVDSNNPSFDSRDNCNAVIETSTNTLLAGCKATVVPNSVTSIGDYAFNNCSGLTSISLPDALSSIGDDAFRGCTGLTSISLPDALSSIGGSAFSGCTGLTSISFPDGLASIGDYAFYECSGLTSISFPDGLVSIGNGAFRRCTGLTSITLPDGLVSIGNSFFQDCSSLASIMLPAGLTSIGNSVFQDCSSLASIMLPAGLTSIGNSAFSGCTGLTSISFPNGLASIGDYAFKKCSGLTSLTLPDGLSSIGNGAFQDCSSLASISFPDGLTSIGNSAFRFCSSLASIMLPAGLTSIGNSAFQDCSSLAFIMFPAGLTSIGNSAFNGCSGLTSISLPDGLSSIGNNAFSECSRLTSITIPESLKVIGNDAFRYCMQLRKVDYASMESLCNITFGNFRSNPICNHGRCPLLINGNEVTDVIIPEGVSSIRNYTFCLNHFISITIPKSVTSIGMDALSCWNLTSIFVKRREPAFFNSSADVEDSSADVKDWFFDEFPPNYNATLYVPLGCKAAYEAADVWKDFAEIVELNLDNYLYAKEVTIRPGGKKTIAIQLDDVKTLIAGEFRLQLPAGFRIEKDEDGYLKAELVSERDNHHSFEVTDEGNGRYHFLCYSGQNRAFKGDYGDFIKLTIVADEDVEENSYSAEVKDIIFSDESEQQVDIDNCTFKISVVDYVPGDANHDGLLNVMDIVKVVGKIMGNPTSDFFFAAADIDDNSKVNVMDLVNLVEIIMNTASQAPAMTAFDQTAAIYGGLDLFKADEKTITMNVAGATNHIAAQFYVSLSGKAVLNDVVSDKSHKTEFTRLDDGRYMVMVYSGSNATFKDDCPIKLQVSSDCSAMIEDVVFIDADNAPVAFEAAELGNTQGIMSIGASFEQPADIYSVSGKLIKRGATSTLGLTKGVYVVNNEKIIVK